MDRADGRQCMRVCERDLGRAGQGRGVRDDRLTLHSLELLLVAAPALLLEDLLLAADCSAALSADGWGTDDELDVFLMERVNWAHRIFKNRGLDRWMVVRL